jgi:hypothetical protein
MFRIHPPGAIALDLVQHGIALFAARLALLLVGASVLGRGGRLRVRHILERGALAMARLRERV